MIERIKLMELLHEIFRLGARYNEYSSAIDDSICNEAMDKAQTIMRKISMELDSK